MNNLMRFKKKMLIVLMFCTFMTFSMLVYVMKLTEKCENPANEMCFQISKNPVVKPNYFFHNSYHNHTEVTSQILKPSFASPENVDLTKTTTATERGYYKIKRTTREVLKVLNFSVADNYSSSSSSKSLRNQSKRSSEEVPSSSLVSHTEHKFYHLISNQSTFGNSTDRFPLRKTPARKDLALKSNHTDMFDKEFQIGRFNSSAGVYADRQKNLRRLCHKHMNPVQLIKVKRLKLNHILIDEKHKILYCYVPKVACTNWKRIFLVLTGKVNNISEVINLPSSEVHAKNLFKSLQNYSISEVQKITEEYTKFIFVRHPFERLLSAFRNKLEQHYDSSKYFQARFGKFIIKNFRKNPSNVSLEKGDDVTFAEFANYLVSSDPKLYNEHWQRVVDLCHPCLINYDFIGKYESLIQDSNFLLKYLGLNVSFPILPKPSTTALNLKKYFGTLEESTVYKLYNIYEMDFRLFGYSLFNTSNGFNS